MESNKPGAREAGCQEPNSSKPEGSGNRGTETTRFHACQLEKSTPSRAQTCKRCVVVHQDVECAAVICGPLGSARDLLGSVQPAHSPLLPTVLHPISGSLGLWKSQQLTRGPQTLLGMRAKWQGLWSFPGSLPCCEFYNLRPAFTVKKN